MGLSGAVVGIRNGVNEEFYEKKGIKAVDILMGRNGVCLPKGRENAMDEVYMRLDQLAKKAEKEEGLFAEPVTNIAELVSDTSNPDIIADAIVAEKYATRPPLGVDADPSCDDDADPSRDDEAGK